MKTIEMLNPIEEFMKSALQVQENRQHIERLGRQANIALLNMKTEGAVDIHAFESIVGRAVELRLLDADDDLTTFKPETIEAVATAFDYIKLNVSAIIDLAYTDPAEYQKRIDPMKTPIRMSNQPPRRHFFELTP